MTQLFTASYRAYTAGMGQAVVISPGLPRWRPEAASWPRCWLLTPTPELFREPDDDVFAAGYAARLDRSGPRKVALTLEKIARDHGTDRLVLLCHEADVSRCHRGQFTRWLLAATGEAAEELGPQ